MIKDRIFYLVIFLAICACAPNYEAELRKIPEYLQLTKDIEKYDTFKNFPPMALWRLLIDGRKQSKGPLVFDDEEPGYLAGLSRGLSYVLENKDAPLTVESIEEIRRRATEDVGKIDRTFFNKEIGGNRVSFELAIGSNATPDGIYDLKEKMKNDPNRSVAKNDEGKLELRRRKMTRAELYPLVKKILDNYEKSAKSIRDMIMLCQDLDQLHPFNDGNIRTFVILLLQKELARMGKTPVIQYNPNRFDAYSIDELEKEIHRSQRNFESYLSQP